MNDRFEPRDGLDLSTAAGLRDLLADLATYAATAERPDLARVRALTSVAALMLRTMGTRAPREAAETEVKEAREALAAERSRTAVLESRVHTLERDLQEARARGSDDARRRLAEAEQARKAADEHVAELEKQVEQYRGAAQQAGERAGTAEQGSGQFRAKLQEEAEYLCLPCIMQLRRRNLIEPVEGIPEPDDPVRRRPAPSFLRR